MLHFIPFTVYVHISASKAMICILLSLVPPLRFLFKLLLYQREPGNKLMLIFALKQTNHH